MADLMEFTCPVDDLNFNMDFLDGIAQEMSTMIVGQKAHLWTDTTIECPNGHKWAVRWNVLFTRTQ